jgi:glyoxylase-like metal-dependent hydrolase (beta-lactamase superfamily II)
MEVAEDVQLLTQGVTNFYLIEEAGRFTVVDAGTPGDWDFFVRSLTTLGQLVDLEAVLLTHAHPDHTGFAEKARTETAATVWWTRPTLKRPAPASPARRTARSRNTCSGPSSTGPFCPSAAGARPG